MIPGKEVIGMRKTNDEIRDIQHKRQRQGMQDLRFLSLLLFLGLLLYTALNFYVVSRIEATFDLFKQYTIYALIGGILWCVPLRMLWSFNRLGRLLYWVLLIVNGYVYKDVYLLWDMEMKPVEFKYICLFLLVLKCAMLLYGGGRLLFSSTIRSIWNVDDLFDEELEELEKTEPVKHTQAPKLTQVEEKAHKLLKKAAIRLGVCLYLSVLLIFIMLSLLASSLPDLYEAIGAIQYPLFSECLFSIMIWSITVYALYIGKSWSPYLIIVSVFGELLRIVVSYTQYIDMFRNEIIPMEIKLLYIVIEVMRYLILLFSCHSVFSHPLLYAYRKGGKKRQKR